MKCSLPVSSSQTSSLKAVIILAVSILCIATSQAEIIYLSANATGLAINFSYDSTNSTIQIGGSTGTYGSLYTDTVWAGFSTNYLGMGEFSPVGYSATESLAFETPINASST